MLKKKMTYAQEFLAAQPDLFECPKCHEELQLVDVQSLGCVNNHRYNLSKKGTIHFPDHHVSSDYDKEMLEHRRFMIQSGLYQPIIKTLQAILKEYQHQVIVDMGCGEGSFLIELIKGLDNVDAAIGFDLSKDGVLLASDYASDGFWFVGDITAMPFQNQSVDCLLNIFSPSHYDEMSRVLTNDGLVIKVIPEQNYLKEMRMLFYRDKEDKQNYSNEKIYNKFQDSMKIIDEKRCTYTVPVTSENYEHMLGMSPLMWGASQAAKEYALNHPFKELTVDVKILIAKKA
ncbi:methyltransferase domain-containing protein [Vagococcus penaei]|uniref:Methyltransferase domain-containing protein n=1 Tax=Vagococcus penaei TaxID=633807 RepID=A0A1Q2D6W6_9ENTE|nr:methyltransferase domain-containing protein [Vagococcus penaei]AQP54166.1 hypothetical protein BW732_07995 [Vagococcus penaei]